MNIQPNDSKVRVLLILVIGLGLALALLFSIDKPSITAANFSDHQHQKAIQRLTPAATIEVTTPDDDFTNNGNCRLREAI